jgi:hypothetical protein
MEVLRVYTIYDSPADYPGLFVARAFYITRTSTPGEVIATGRSIEEVRAKLPIGLHRIVRDESDSPSIVETWI